MDWRFLATIIVTVALGIATLILALKLAKKRQPVWAYKTTKIIELGNNALPELKLTFNEQPVSDVYRTRVILFNKGNEPILKDNVTESIAIHFKGANILQQPTILAKSREGIGVSAKQVVKDGDDAIEISFQYLDHNDGAVIEVLHTTSQDIKPSGNIIGTRKIRYIGEFAPTLNQPLYNSLISVVVLIGCIVAYFIYLFKKGIWSDPGDIIPLVFFFAMLGAVAAPFLRCRRFPRWSAVKS